mmetsp:Transcript_2286/g.2631  ORF Transcript_2286/g.2631 Transcript_2286/m.2631 type:complete len:89 (+) Transcript_2286:248-514(+)
MKGGEKFLLQYQQRLKRNVLGDINSSELKFWQRKSNGYYLCLELRVDVLCLLLEVLLRPNFLIVLVIFSPFSNAPAITPDIIKRMPKP